MDGVGDEPMTSDIYSLSIMAAMNENSTIVQIPPLFFLFACSIACTAASRLIGMKCMSLLFTSKYIYEIQKFSLLTSKLFRLTE